MLGACVALFGTWFATAVAHADALSSLEAPLRHALQSGSWVSALGVSFAAGVATSLTPCVYPMIVITVSVFGARETKSKLAAAKLSGAFVLGIAALFTPLGVIAAMTGNVFGSQLVEPNRPGVAGAVLRRARGLDVRRVRSRPAAQSEESARDGRRRRPTRVRS